MLRVQRRSGDGSLDVAQDAQCSRLGKTAFAHGLRSRYLGGRLFMIRRGDILVLDDGFETRVDTVAIIFGYCCIRYALERVCSW